MLSAPSMAKNLWNTNVAIVAPWLSSSVLGPHTFATSATKSQLKWKVRDVLSCVTSVFDASWIKWISTFGEGCSDKCDWHSPVVASGCGLLFSLILANVCNYDKKITRRISFQNAFLPLMQYFQHEQILPSATSPSVPRVHSWNNSQATAHWASVTPQQVLWLQCSTVLARSKTYAWFFQEKNLFWDAAFVDKQRSFDLSRNHTQLTCE